MESSVARAKMSPHSQSGKETTTLTPNPDVAKPLDLTAAGCYLQHLHLAVLETDEATEKQGYGLFWLTVRNSLNIKGSDVGHSH